MSFKTSSYIKSCTQKLLFENKSLSCGFKDRMYSLKKKFHNGRGLKDNYQNYLYEKFFNP